MEGWIDDMRSFVLLNSISVISGQWEVDNERLCAMKLRLLVEKISPRARIELGPLDQ